MSPSAISPVETPILVKKGVSSLLTSTAPSITPSTNISTAASHLSELNASLLHTTPTDSPKIVPALSSPEILSGNSCTDHMLTANWTSTTGWAPPHILPYGPLSLEPTASVLHYATTCFEGMKAYRGHDGQIRLFRPSLNCSRMVSSASRIALPAFDPRELEKLVKAFIAYEGPKWLPKSRPGTFLYLRPTLIANSAALGVSTPNEATLFIVAAFLPSIDEHPAVPLPSSGHITPQMRRAAKPGLKLLASCEDSIRAWPGGFGYAKVGANYAPSLIAQAEARASGYDSVLWLFGQNAEVTEAGTSNFMVVLRSREGRKQLKTAPLGDKIILDGVTRRSVLELARERLRGELEVVEEKFGMGEVVEAAREGRLVEAFTCGTAYFVSAVSEINYRGVDLDVPLAEGNIGTYAKAIKNWLRDIKYGNVQHPWGVVIGEVE